MKLSERLKKIPKEKIVIFVTLTVLLIATVTIILVCAFIPPDKPTSGTSNTEDTDDVIGVFNELTETSDTQSDESSLAESTTEEATSEKAENTTPETTEQKAETTEPEIIPPTDSNGLNFKSNGDGTCSVIGIGTCESIEVKIPSRSPAGDIVTSIGERAFNDCYRIMTISIPATVKNIGTGAFRGCSGLAMLEVDALNSTFCSYNGVLYTKDRSALLCYPPSAQGSKFLLPTNVKIISAYAFENAFNLTGILYEGSIIKFQSIDVLSGNEKFASLSITCNYSGN